MITPPTGFDDIGEDPPASTQTEHDLTEGQERRAPVPRNLAARRPPCSSPPPPADLKFDVVSGHVFVPLAFRDDVNAKARRIGQRLRLSPDELEDLKQTLWLDVTAAFGKFELARGTEPIAFARAALRFAALHRARDLVYLRLRGLGLRGLADPAALDIGHPSRAGDPRRGADLAMDLSDVINRLPHHLGSLAQDLMTKSVADIARDAGVHRGTVRRRLRALEAVFAPFAEIFDDRRNTPAPDAEMYLCEEDSAQDDPNA